MRHNQVSRLIRITWSVPHLPLAQARSSPHLRTALSAAAVLGLAAFFRLYQLEALPGEWYGDLTALQTKVRQILDGEWPTYFFAAQGFAYHYLIAPLIALLGHAHLSYKLASVIVSLGVVALTMLIGHEIDGPELAFVAGYVTAVSSSLLIFSRLGDYLVIIPLLSAATVWLLIRYAKHPTARRAATAVVVAALGLFAAPHTVVLLPLCLLFLLAFLPRPRRRHIQRLRGPFFVAAVGLSLFAAVVWSQPDNFRGGYLGAKLYGSSAMSATEFLTAFAERLRKTALMLHVHGDHVFRSNPPFAPHLDRISGALFLLGLAALALRRWRPFAPLLLTFLVVLILPSAWPHVLDIEVPSASRTSGILPFVYLLVALGILALCKLPARFTHLPAGVLLMALLLSMIGALNLARYFDDYAAELPNRNVPFGRIIAHDIRLLAQPAAVYVVGCCWGAWTQPEVEGIRFAFRDLPATSFVTWTSEACHAVGERSERSERSTPVHIYLDPNDTEAAHRLMDCAPTGSFVRWDSPYGDAVFLRYDIPAPP